MHKSFLDLLFANRMTVLTSCLLFLLIAVEGNLLHVRAQNVMESQLKSELRTSAALGAQFFSGEEIDRIVGAEDLQTAHYASIVERLNSIRQSIPNIEYIYIMRKTDDPLTLAFVADGDSLFTFAQMDANGDGVLQASEEASYPGDSYDIGEIFALQSEAFLYPTVDEDITNDHWGKAISGYAPIRRSNGSVAGVLGIDMNAANFITLAHRAFSPLLLLLVTVLGLLVAVFVGTTLWQRQLKMLTTIENERTSLLALATHQLGAPVTSIRWWMEILRDGGFCDDNNACDMIEKSVDRITGIIRALCDVDRTERNTLQSTARIVSTANAVNAAVKEAQLIVDQKQQTIVCESDTSGNVFIDPKLLVGVLQELLENASAYSPKQSEIHVRCQTKGSRVLISVIDEGCGVPKGEEERIFEKMTRGSNASLWRPDGNGLGLYIARMIIERAGGTIKLRKNPMKGSTFEVSLPAA